MPAAKQTARRRWRLPRRHHQPGDRQRYWRIADRNIGIPTGEGAGFWVLDVDGEAGEATLAALVSKHGPLPPTREVTTGSRSAHLFPLRRAAPVISRPHRHRARCARRPAPTSFAHRASIRAGASIPGAHRLSRWPRRRTGWCASPAPSRADHHRTGGGGHQDRPEPGRPVPTASPRSMPRSRRWRRWRPARAITRSTWRASGCFSLVAGGELDGDAVADRLLDACQCNGLIADDGLRLGDGDHPQRPARRVAAPAHATGREHDRAAPVSARRHRRL